MKHSQSKINTVLDTVIKAAFTQSGWDFTDEERELIVDLSKELKDYKNNMHKLDYLEKSKRENLILLSHYRNEYERLILRQDIQQCE